MLFLLPDDFKSRVLDGLPLYQVWPRFRVLPLQAIIPVRRNALDLRRTECGAK